MSLRIVAISDTHGNHANLEVPEGDVLIHAGDCTRHGHIEELAEFAAWFEALPHKHKIVIAGNHDWCCEREPDASAAVFKTAHYLLDASVEVEGIKVYGSPWTPFFYDWAFQREAGELMREVWQDIPEDTDVLVTHGPPRGRHDWTIYGNLAGCADLRARVDEIRPKLHIFGHIHESYGESEHDGTRFVNASNVNVKLKIENRPIIIDLQIDK